MVEGKEKETSKKFVLTIKKKKKSAEQNRGNV